MKRMDPLCYVRLVACLGKRLLLRLRPPPCCAHCSRCFPRTDTHDVSRDRGEDWNAVLRTLRLPVLIVGIESDMLYPIGLQREIHAALADSELVVLDSPHGHDGFLIELDRVHAAVLDWWARSAARSGAVPK